MVLVNIATFSYFYLCHYLCMPTIHGVTISVIIIIIIVLHYYYCACCYCLLLILHAFYSLVY